MKKCRYCHQEKSITEFDKKPGGKDGLNARCKKCNSEYGKRYRALNKGKEKKRHKKYKEDNKEEIKIKDRVYRQNNKENELQKNRKWRKNNPEKAKARDRKMRQKNVKERRNLQLISKFDITLDEYHLLSAKQGGLCAICIKPEIIFDKRANKTRELAVDHDHETSKIRGLLCGACNKALGLFKDDINTLTRALEYLRTFKNKSESQC